MTSNVINLEDEKFLRSYDAIGRAIVDYIMGSGLSWEIEAAKRVYFGKYIEPVSKRKGGISYKPFIEWLIFSYKLDNGLSLLESIYEGYYEKLAPSEKVALSNLKDTRESLYRVCSVRESSVLVRDVFSRKSVVLCDNLLCDNVKRYEGIFGRFVRINEKNIPIPGYTLMSNTVLKEVEQYILQKFRQNRRFNAVMSLEEFICSNSLLIHRYFLKNLM